jgi:hypothetical protein
MGRGSDFYQYARTGERRDGPSALGGTGRGSDHLCAGRLSAASGAHALPCARHLPPPARDPARGTADGRAHDGGELRRTQSLRRSRTALSAQAGSVQTHPARELHRQRLRAQSGIRSLHWRRVPTAAVCFLAPDRDRRRNHHGIHQRDHGPRPRGTRGCLVPGRFSSARDCSRSLRPTSCGRARLECGSRFAAGCCDLPGH